MTEPTGTSGPATPQATLSRDTPLVFRVMLRHGQAARAALAAAARERLKDELEERVRAGELSREEYQRIREDLTRGQARS